MTDTNTSTTSQAKPPKLTVRDMTVAYGGKK